MSDVEPVYLFLLIPNDSGSTWLYNCISLCDNAVSFKSKQFPGGIDGQGVCYYSVGEDVAFPKAKNKVFSEKSYLWSTPDAWDWNVIKTQWSNAWSQNEHYLTANPKVYLEKTLVSVFSADMYTENFDNVRFIIVNRNPYAVAEGVRRTERGLDNNFSILRCVKHWVACSKRQMYNFEKYKEISIKISYEDLAADPRDVEHKIKQLIPPLHDMDLTKEAEAHSLEGTKYLPFIDFNGRQIKNLSQQDVWIISEELKKVPEVMEYFGYEVLDSEVFRYEVTEEEVGIDHREYKELDLPYVPFTLNDTQLLELGRRYHICLTTQDYDIRIHDHPSDVSKNKPWKYLQDAPKGSKVLFVGTGAGREVLAGSAMGLEAYGITIGSNNINFGRNILGLDDSHFVEGCNELLPFPAHFFDVVAGFQIMEHSISPLMFLLEQSRVLVDGGCILLEWPPASDHSTHGADPQHQVCFTPGQVEGLLLKAGFDNVSLFYEDMSVIPKDKYWVGEQEKGYVVVRAQKVNTPTSPDGDPIDTGYLDRFRNLGKGMSSPAELAT